MQQGEIISTILILLTLLAVDASTIPTLPSLFQPNITAATRPIDATVRCSVVSSEQPLRASDCKAAIAQLPQDIDGDVHMDPYDRQYIYPKFSRTSHEERHRLPVIVKHGSCIVEVSLVPTAYSDDSSWRIIALRAGNVVQQCVEMKHGASGLTVTGEEKDIKILVYAPLVLPVLLA